jgi:hypothetical protein
MRTLYIALSICIVLLVVPGCGKKGKTIKTSGIVYLDDHPFDGASVMFIPVDDSGQQDDSRMAASARSGSDGKFRLTTRNPNDGAAPGAYKILVSYEEQREVSGAESLAGKSKMDPGRMMQGFYEEQRKGGGGAKKETKIPASYSDLKTTPLKATIPADGDIELRLRSTGG